MSSTGGSHIPTIPRCRKNRGSPLFQWKLGKKHTAKVGNGSPVNFRQRSPKSALSARKLAAGLWQLLFIEVSGDGAAPAAFHFANSCELPILLPLWGCCCSQLESSPACLKFSKEEVTKEEGPALSEASNVFTKIHSRKLLGERKLMGDSVVCALVRELVRAKRCISKLKADQKSFKKKVEQFVRKLEGEKVFWKLRELNKIQAMLDDLRDKVARERRSRERMESINAKLVYELAKAKLFAKQFMTNYEEEKKERELMEEVCNKLAMQIGEEKAKLERLQRDFMQIRQEVEEERKMFQMAELWREESVQMKLVDAKLALEDKYNQMIQLIAYLQTFLRSRGDELDTMELRDDQLIKRLAESINIQCIAEPSYDFSKSNDIFYISEEFRKDKVNERVIKPDSPPNLTGPSSTIHIASPEEDGLNNNFVLHYQSSTSCYGTGLEVTNSCETVIHVEDQNFCPPPQRRGGTSLDDGTTSSVAKTCQYKRPHDGWYQNHDSVAKQNSEDLPFDACKGRLSSSSIQSGGIPSDFLYWKGSGEGGFRHLELLGQGNSTDTMNPHITRGMKGCIEWPRRIPKTNSKAIPLEERVRSQKSQLQHILKSKA